MSNITTQKKAIQAVPSACSNSPPVGKGLERSNIPGNKFQAFYTVVHLLRDPDITTPLTTLVSQQEGWLLFRGSFKGRTTVVRNEYIIFSPSFKNQDLCTCTSKHPTLFLPMLSNPRNPPENTFFPVGSFLLTHLTQNMYDFNTSQ